MKKKEKKVNKIGRKLRKDIQIAYEDYLKAMDENNIELKKLHAFIRIEYVDGKHNISFDAYPEVVL